MQRLRCVSRWRDYFGRRPEDDGPASAPSALLTNARWGLLTGLVFGSAYMLFALFLYLILGSAPFEANDVALSDLALAYLLGGVLGSTIMQRLTRA